MIEQMLSDWFCWQCGMLTPGGQPDPYPCCTKPLVFRWRAVQSIPAVEPTSSEAAG